jgi:2-oxoglutarate ferredoxin oxidoreductase subunit alpha
MGFRNGKSSLSPGSHFLSGTEAVVEGAITAGCRYFGGYPITPATDIAEIFSMRSKEAGAVFIQMEDEIASICSVIGASWAGAKAMSATSGPGFSLMQEAIGYAAVTETPIVIALIQRVGPSTGQGTTPASGEIMQAKWGSHGDYQVIGLCPWSVQEMYDQTVNAFNLAEQYRVPVILLAEAVVGRLEERVGIKEDVKIFDRTKETGIAPLNLRLGDNQVQPMPIFGAGHQVKVTGQTRGYYYGGMPDAEVQSRLMERLHTKILDNKSEIIEYDSHYMEDAEVAVVSYGFTARSALFAIKALREEGKKVGMLRLKTLWPFADRLIVSIGSNIKRIFVPEMNKGQVAGEIMKYTSSEVISYTQTNGEIIHPGTIMEKLRRLSQ